MRPPSRSTRRLPAWGPAPPVTSTGEPLSVELGPGLIGSIYDGIQRPLDEIRKISGNNLQRGVEVPALGRETKWEFVPALQPGDPVAAGDVLGTVQETEIVSHKIMAPPGVVGKVKSIQAGSYTVTETVAVIETPDGDEVPLTLMQKWPVRRGRPYKQKLSPQHAPDHRTAGHRHPVPPGQGGRGGGARALRQRQDRGAAPAGQMVRGGHRGLYWLRRAGQRDDRCLKRVPRAHRP